MKGLVLGLVYRIAFIKVLLCDKRLRSGHWLGFILEFVRNHRVFSGQRVVELRLVLKTTLLYGDGVEVNQLEIALVFHLDY